MTTYEHHIVHELQDTAAARQFLLQGLWLQRAVSPTEESVGTALDWAMELASSGEPLPPIGFIADVGHLTLGSEQDFHGNRERASLPHVAPSLIRAYEDYVLGKLYADSTFERGSDAVAHYQTPRDRARGIVFLLTQFRNRAGFGGVLLSPSLIRGLKREVPQELLAEGWESLSSTGLTPLLEELYESLIASVRDTGEVLGMVDVFELEHETALADFGQRVALRQVLEAAGHLESKLPEMPPRTWVRKQQVPTHILDEDIYPIGGFTSISNRGTIESLLHSQLAYMEPDTAERPDLFDIKFLRDELLYYSRDENQFLRRRRTFVFALYPDLVETRIKDADLPWQRIIMALGTLVVLVRKLLAWLSEDALLLEFHFVHDGKVDSQGEPLAAERQLLEMIFRTEIVGGTVTMHSTRSRELAARCTERARRSLCHGVCLSTRDRRIQPENTVLTRLNLSSLLPKGTLGEDGLELPDDANSLTAWEHTAAALLRHLM